MFSNTKTTVEQGSVGLASAVFNYQRLGYNVLLPLVDNQDYDLVVEKDKRFYTVQVKTSRVVKNGNYSVQLKKVRPNRTTNVITPMSVVDLLYVLCSNGDCYSIPYENLTSYNELRVSLHQQFKI
jgi:hypothetical protein